MSYAVMPYAVDVQILQAPHAHTEDPEGFLTRLQGLYCTGDELEPTHESMRRLFYAEDLTDVSSDEGPVYGYTLEVLCERFGTMLDNDAWSAMHLEWFEVVQNALTRAGGRFDLNDLIFSGPPVTLPPLGEFPAIGHLLRAQIPEQAQALDAVDLSMIDDPDVVESIEQMSGWLRWCQEHEDLDLVCFYH